MTIVKVSAICGLVLLIGGGVPLAAPGQTYTARPGDPTPPFVWIQNTPLSVEVRNTPAVTLSTSTVIQAKRVGQAWDYQTVLVTGSDLTALSRAGADGWEATGIQFPERNAVQLLLKRPR